MIQKKTDVVPGDSHDTPVPNEKLTYWRSSPRCFSIRYQGIVTDICEGDLGYGHGSHGRCDPRRHRLQTKKAKKVSFERGLNDDRRARAFV
jgi:hypothetical protein